MSENYNTNENFAGEVSEYVVSDKVLAKITKKVVDKVDGVLDLQGGILNTLAKTFTNEDSHSKGISITQQGKDALVEAGIVLEYGKKAEAVFNQLEKTIKDEVKTLTGVNVKAVKVNIVDILTREEYQKQQQDEKKDLENNNQY